MRSEVRLPETSRRRSCTRERGSALVLTLVLAAVFVFLGGTFLTISLTDRTIASNEADGTQAFNAAEAGIEHAIAELPDQDLDTLLAGGGNLFTNQSLGVSRYDVSVTNNLSPTYPTGVVPADPGGASDDTDGYVVLTSTGRANRAVRTVTVVARKTSGGPPLYAHGVYGDLKIATSGGVIDGYNGSSGCSLRTNGEIDPGSTIVDGDATAGGIVKNPGQFSGTVTEGAPFLGYPTVACPTGGYTPASDVPSGPGIDYNATTGILKLSGSANLTLAPGTYYFKEISASTLVTLNLSGGGHTDINVDLKLDFKGASQLNPTGNASDLTIWGCGTANISLALKDGGQNHMVIYAPTGYFDSSSGTDMYGVVIAKEFKMSGNSSFHCDGGLTGSGGGSGSTTRVAGTWTELW